MNKELKIYHTETQEDYDDLMIELENQGYVWTSGWKPTAKSRWFEFQEETVIYVNEVIEYSSLSYAKKECPYINIIKHKAKGVEQMDKVVVPQFVADWFKFRSDVSLRVLLNKLVSYDYGKICDWVEQEGVRNAQSIIAKMYLYGYEVEEKKYYWRKKRECFLDFEYSYSPVFINLDTEDRDVFFDSKSEYNCFKTKFTESEIRELVSEEDFNKLEKAEISDDEC